jgi:hypothetical protein
VADAVTCLAKAWACGLAALLAVIASVLTGCLPVSPAMLPPLLLLAGHHQAPAQGADAAPAPRPHRGRHPPGGGCGQAAELCAPPPLRRGQQPAEQPRHLWPLCAGVDQQQRGPAQPALPAAGAGRRGAARLAGVCLRRWVGAQPASRAGEGGRRLWAVLHLGASRCLKSWQAGNATITMHHPPPEPTPTPTRPPTLPHVCLQARTRWPTWWRTC